jgi:hypothetical protein
MNEYLPHLSHTGIPRPTKPPVSKKSQRWIQKGHIFLPVSKTFLATMNTVQEDRFFQVVFALRKRAAFAKPPGGLETTKKCGTG